MHAASPLQHQHLCPCLVGWEASSIYCQLQRCEAWRQADSQSSGAIWL